MKNFLAWLVVVALVFGLGGFLLGKSGQQTFGNFTEEYTPKVFHDTVTIEGATTLGTGAVTLSGLVTLSGSNCTTATWNPPAFSSTTVASTSIPFVGAAGGDVLLASFASVTSSREWFITAKVGPAGSSTVSLQAYPSATPADAYNTALNLTTSTVKVCKLQ